MLTAIKTIIALVVGLGFFMIYRNELINGIRRQIIQETSRKAKAAMDRKEHWEHYFDELTLKYDYNKMMFQLNKWSYEAFTGQKRDK
ncbi:MAG: hypothetical protein PHO27_12075 [Sulfuricurvum sp.]|jgi:hypothetical protein|nr:hypothetical protein [Sulfuricurvum sp.]